MRIANRLAPLATSPNSPSGRIPPWRCPWVWAQIGVCGLLGWTSFTVTVDHVLPRAVNQTPATPTPSHSLSELAGGVPVRSTLPTGEGVSDSVPRRFPSRLASSPLPPARLGRW